MTTDFYLPMLLAKNSRHLWITFDSYLSIKFLNSSLVDITGLSANNFEGKNLDVLDSIISPHLKILISDLIRKKVSYQNLGSYKINRQDINSIYDINIDAYLIFKEGLFKYGILLGVDKISYNNLEQQPLRDSQGNFSIRRLTKDTEQVETEQKLATTNASLINSNTKYKKANKQLQEILDQLEAQTAFCNQINRELSIKSDALNRTAIIEESDRNGHIISVNDQFLKISGYKKSEILGKSHCIKYKSLFYSNVHEKKFFDEIWDQLNIKKFWRGEICNVNKAGENFWLLKTVIPLTDTEGNVISYYSFSSDISLQKQKEKELMNSKIASEETAAAKEEFLSVMSHEIRTPLNSVIGLTNLLQRKNPREDQVELINTLKKSTDNLMYLVNNILDFNRIKSGNVFLDQVNFDLSESLNQLHSTFSDVAQEKDILLTIENEFDSPLWLKGDIHRLYQILNNVMHNALKFTEKGEVKLLVKRNDVEFYDKGVNIEFILTDTGIGIPEDQLKCLFVPFQQSEKHISRQYGGTGLGLSIVKGLVELLGGSINVASNLKGSTFHISIPFLKPDILKEENSVSEIGEETKSLENFRILYVEDVPSNQMLIAELLKDFGAECCLADDGNQAIDFTLEESFDLILMDLQLPKIDGFAVTQKIRSQQKGLNLNTPILAFTAEPSSEELYKRIRDSGLQGCIHKPFHFDSLIDKIKLTIKEQSFKKGKAALFNLDYYKKAFKNDPTKLSKIRELLIQDFTRFLEVFLNNNSNKDEVREELHRINPIIKNIESFELIDLLEDYKGKMLSNNDSSFVKYQIKTILIKIINSLNLIKE